jgi:2-methylcitrate dehydratase PrpD
MSTVSNPPTKGLGPTETDPARDIAAFVSRTRFEDVPPEVVERLKKSILDVLGCAVYGIGNQAPQAVLRYAQRRGGTESSIFCRGGSASAFDAALVNGTYVLSTNFGEGFTRCMVHPGSSTIPALLAVGQRERASGRELLTAAAVAYDLLVRLGMTMGQGFVLKQGLFQPSVLGTFAAAAAVGRLLGYGAEQIGTLLGVAACHTPSPLMKGARTLVSDTFEGYAGALGVLCADLVAAGITGPVEWVAPWYTAMVSEYDLAPLTDRLGDYWYTSSGGLRVKTRPIMAMASPVIEALAQMLEHDRVDHGAIDEIVAESSGRIEIGRIYRPATVEAMRASIPFLVAAALVYQDRFRADPYLTSFITDDLLGDSTVAQLADRVRLVKNDEFDYNLERATPSADGSSYIKFEGRVTIRFRDGPERAQYADLFALGTGNMSRDRMAGKFRAVSAGVMPEQRIEDVIATVWRLDELDDVSELVALMSEW